MGEFRFFFVPTKRERSSNKKKVKEDEHETEPGESPTSESAQGPSCPGGRHCGWCWSRRQPAAADGMVVVKEVVAGRSSRRRRACAWRGRPLKKGKKRENGE